MVSYVKAIANATYQIVAPVASEMLNHLPLTRHLKAGVSSIAIGATLAGQTYFANNLIVDSPSLKKLRYITYGTAAFCVGYGLFEVALGISSLWTHFKDQEIVSQVTEKLRKCPAANELWNEVEKEGPFSVRLYFDEQVQSDYFWKETERTINLKRSLSDTHKLIGTLYELCNAKQSRSFQSLKNPLHAGTMSFLEYAERVVKIEWKSMLCHHEVAAACVQTQHWNSQLDYYGQTCKTWNTADSFWQNYIRTRTNERHSQDMLQEWFKQAFIPFCKKTPQAAECHMLPR